MLKGSFKTGLSFGLTSGIITTLGLMVGLHSGTHSKLVVIGGIVTIAVADAFSDALGIHVSQESENQHSTRAIWESTLATFLAKLLFALTFLIPILVLPIISAIVASIGWGLLLLGLFSYHMAKEQRVRPWPVIAEHLVIALVVITITHYVGHWIEATFRSI
jgi:VIT1/CCC1 family predicted Fe2+/Mn2+ transporter